MTETDANVRVAPREAGKYVAQLGLIFVAYFVMAKLGQILPITGNGHIGPVWPASGVALAAFLLLGYQAWPGVAAGAFFFALLTPNPPAAAVVYGIGTTLAPLSATFLLRRVVNFNPSLSRLRDTLALIAFGAFGGSVVSASIGTWVLYAIHVPGWPGFGRAWLIYWLGDSMGVLLVTPLVLSLPKLRWSHVRTRTSELVMLLLLLATSCFIVFGDPPLIHGLHVLAFAVLPLIMWAAVRFGMSGATLSTFFIAAVAAVETAFGSGPFAQDSPFVNAVLLDVFFALLSLSGLTLAAVIAEREQAESEREVLVGRQAATQARLRFASIVESSDDAIIGTDVNGIITDWNQGAERLYGYSADEMIGKPTSTLALPERSDDFAEIMTKIRYGGSVKHFETIRQKKDGSHVEVSLTVSPIFDTEGQIVGTSGIARDISERKHQEAVLRESEERFRLMSDNAPGVIWLSDINKLCTYFNKTWLEFTGRAMEAELGNGWVDGVHPDDLQTCLDTYIRSFDRREKFRMEYRLRRHDGEYRWILDIGVPRFNQDRSFAGHIGMGVDVTERKQTEQALRESEERLRMATEAGRMLAYEWDAATDEIVRSDGVTKILGEDEGTQTTGQHILTMIPPEDRERLIAAVDKLSPAEPHLRISYRMVRSDGAVIWVDRNSRAYFDEHGRMLRIVGILADITDRVRAEEVLRQKDRELSEAQRLAAVGSWHWDVQNDIAIWSEELYRIAGLDPMLPAPNYKECPRLLSAESWERLQRAAEATLRDGRSYELDLEMVRPDGTTRWVTARAEAVSDTEGRVVGLRGTSQDITERKLSEEVLKDMGRKLLEAQEQERARIGRELHDDIGQRLALLSVEIQQTKEIVPEAVVELRSRMDELDDRTLEIAIDVQTLAHQLHSSKLEYLGLVAAMRSFCVELAQKQKVDINFAHEGIPAIVPQETSLCLFRVMQEALQNALKHSGVQHFDVKVQGSPQEIHLTVRDSGIGFDPELTTETQGLGLISMQERVRLVKGTISITSRPQCGTEIRVRVPLSGVGARTEQARSAGP